MRCKICNIMIRWYNNSGVCSNCQIRDKKYVKYHKKYLKEHREEARIKAKEYYKRKKNGK